MGAQGREDASPHGGHRPIQQGPRWTTGMGRAVCSLLQLGHHLLCPWAQVGIGPLFSRTWTRTCTIGLPGHPACRGQPMGLLSLHNCVRANSYEKSPDAISLCILLVVSWGPQQIWCPHEKHTLSGPDSSGHLKRCNGLPPFWPTAGCRAAHHLNLV